MRILKRMLPAALSVLLLLGVMTTGALAGGYADDGAIHHPEAVALAASLKLMEAGPDGSFDPGGTVTRGEMARLACAVLGGPDGPLQDAAPAPYSDTAGHPDEPYIAYCAAHGITAGRGDGSFNPDGTVAVSEASKMTLVVMGIDPGLFEFTGRDWRMNVDVKANQVGLYNDFPQLDTSRPITREQAALLLYNALQARVLEPNGDDGAVTLLNRCFGMACYEGELLSAKDGSLVLAAARKDHGDIAPVELTFSDGGGDYAAMLGGQVKIFCPDADPAQGALEARLLVPAD